MHPGALEHGADRPAGDDAGARAGWLQQDDARGLLALHGVRDGAGDTRDLEEVLLGGLDALGDRGRHLLGLAVPDPDHAVAVTDDDQCGEAEPPAALHYLRDPVDGHHPLQVGSALVSAAATVITAVAPFAAACAAPRCCWHQIFLCS